MKPNKKKKIDIKGFFVSHVEKIVLVMVIPVAIFFAYKGTQHEPLSWQPEALEQASAASDKFIRDNIRKAVDEGVAIFPYDTYAEWIKKEIKVDLYRTNVQWLPSLFPEKTKRGAAPVYPVTDLIASSGLGAISINLTSPAAVLAGVTTPAAGETPGSGTTSGGIPNNQIGARWAMVTGLIPIQRQLDTYVNLYSDSVLPDPVRDMPTYIYYEVERAVIEPGQGPGDLQWVKLELLKEYNINRGLWSGVGMDVVDPNYLAPPVLIPMAYPLPPVSKKYGAEVAHPPVIPMMTDSQTDLLQQMETYQKRLLEETFNVDEERLLQNPYGGRAGSIGGMPTGGGMNTGMGSMDSGSGGMGGGVLGAGQLTQEDEEEIFKSVEVTHYLFRYLDFKVEPGKTYRYRVRLHLANPNYELAPNFVETEELAAKPSVVTEYSEPSTMVTIPLESRILASEVTAAATAWGDPTTSIAAIFFDMKDGSEWYVERPLAYRGSTINMKRQQTTNAQLEGVAGSRENMGSTTPRPPRPTRPPARGQRGPVPEPVDPGKKTMDIVSEVTILDMAGGVRLPKATSAAARDVPELRSPEKVMVLEPSGNLVIRSIKADKIEMENIKNPQTVSGTDGRYGGTEGGYDSGRYGSGR